MPPGVIPFILEGVLYFRFGGLYRASVVYRAFSEAERERGLEIKYNARDHIKSKIYLQFYEENEDNFYYF